MNNWLVKQKKDGKTVELGGVKAMTRKGACFEAFGAFRIAHSERGSISVEQVEDDHPVILAIDPAQPGADHSVESMKIL